MMPSWFIEAETLKTQALDRLQQMLPDTRNFSHRPGEWSAAQVVAHLALVEEQLVDEWHVAAKNSPVGKPGRRAGLIVGMASLGMRGPIRIPTVPALDPNEREPNGSGDFAVLSERWASVRKRLPGTFPANGSCLWIIHPVFGALSCQQFGAFLVAHLHHHLRHWPGNDARIRGKE